jgi:hypothetical protein
LGVVRSITGESARAATVFGEGEQIGGVVTLGAVIAEGIERHQDHVGTLRG